MADGPVLNTVGTPTTLRDEAIQNLHAAIISGVLQPGVVYSAPVLSAQLGMSATPVREAMLDLVKEGLVETVRNKGFRVIALSDAELDDLTDIRLLLEVPSVRDVAVRGVSDEEYARLRELAQAIEHYAKSGELIAHNKADLAFHATLLGLLGNPALVELVSSLRSRSRLYGQTALASAGQLLPTAHEHAELLELVRARDAAAAERLMRRHIGHVRGTWATGAPTEI